MGQVSKMHINMHKEEPGVYGGSPPVPGYLTPAPLTDTLIQSHGFRKGPKQQSGLCTLFRGLEIVFPVACPLVHMYVY